ncbi:hypothetical protein GCM10022381_35570 [Leifsonia kafniensis]|uniref:Uncharacterized protein n=1 Tax=Leifsonia kafniensis TaxID=475957 RepID=A0ABP7KXH7_9MICO
MTNLTPGVRQVMQCNSSAGESCLSHGAGHAGNDLQNRVTAATPSKWRDGFVSHLGTGGWIGVELLGRFDATDVDATDAHTTDAHAPDAGAPSIETLWLWNHADLRATLTLGEPVAVHALYHALAVGSERFNVVVASLD